MKVSADFGTLLPAETRLVEWLQAGNRKVFELSNSVPDGGSDAVTLRATFIRHLALGGCDECRLPETGLQVRGAYIDGDNDHSEDTKGLDFEGATLPHDLALVGCHIPDPVILLAARVKNISLNSSELKTGFEGDQLQAEGSVIFHGAKITGEVILLGARLMGDLSFIGATLCVNKDEKDGQTGFAISGDRMQVEGGIFLRGSDITGDVRLIGARLGGDLDCNGAVLGSSGQALNCRSVRVKGNVFLHAAKITGEVRLMSARLGGSLDCDGVELRAQATALNCGGAEVTGTFFWRKGAKASGCIDLTAASFGAINDDPACWPPELILHRCRYGAFQGNNAPTDAKNRLKWLALQQPAKYGHDFWPDPYEHCAKVLREMGHGADARTIMIKRDELLRDSGFVRQITQYGQLGPIMLSIRRMTDAMWRWSTGYGRAPLRALRPLCLFWLIGTGVFFVADRLGEIKPNLPQTQVHPAWVECAEYGARRWASHATQVECFRAQPQGKSYPHFNALFYSADTLFPVVSLEMQSYWIPDDTEPFGKYARWYLWVHSIAGWALTLLAVAGFSGLIKTDNTK